MTERIKPELIAAENNSRVPSSLKMEFVNNELDRLRISDPRQAELLYFQILRARKIMAKEMKKCVAVGIGIENANPERVEAIIDKLFVRFVCKS